MFLRHCSPEHSVITMLLNIAQRTLRCHFAMHFNPALPALFLYIVYIYTIVVKHVFC